MNLQPLLSNSDSLAIENTEQKNPTQLTNSNSQDLQNTTQKVQLSSDEVPPKLIHKQYQLNKRVSCPVNCVSPSGRSSKLVKQKTSRLELQCIEEEKQQKNKNTKKKKTKQIINNSQFFFVFNNLIFQNNEFSSNFRKTSKYQETFHSPKESKAQSAPKPSKNFTATKFWGHLTRLTKKSCEPAQISGKMKVNPRDFITINSQTQIPDELNYESFSEESLDEIYDQALLDQEYSIEQLLNGEEYERKECRKEEDRNKGINCFENDDFFQFNRALQQEYIEVNFREKLKESESAPNDPNQQTNNDPILKELQTIYQCVNYNLYGNIKQIQ